MAYSLEGRGQREDYNSLSSTLHPLPYTTYHILSYYNQNMAQFQEIITEDTYSFLICVLQMCANSAYFRLDPTGRIYSRSLSDPPRL